MIALVIWIVAIFLFLWGTAASLFIPKFTKKGEKCRKGDTDICKDYILDQKKLFHYHKWEMEKASENADKARDVIKSKFDWLGLDLGVTLP